jgi:hypothetical protein
MKGKRLALPFVCLLFLPQAARAQAKATPPTVVVRFSSIDTLSDHVRFLASLAGQKDAAGSIEGLVKQKIGDKGLEGVDSRRPFGFYGRVGKDLDDIAGAILLPIADEKAFLNLLKNLNVQVAKGDGGIYTIKTNSPIDAYLRFANKYAYVTALNAGALEDKNLLDPAKVLAGKPDSAFSLTIQLDQVPEAAKVITTAQVEQALQEAQDHKIPGETPAQKAFRTALLQEVAKLIATVLKEGKELKAEVDVSKKSGDLAGAFSLSGLPGSQMATGIDAMGRSSSLFGGLLKKGAAFNGTGHLQLPEALAKALGDVVDEARGMAAGSIQEPTKKQHVEAFFKALTPTLRAGDLDGALVVISQGNQLTAVGATKLKNGLEVGTTIRGLVSDSLKDLPPKVKDRIKLDIDAAGGTKIHKVELPAEDQGAKEAAKILGELSVYVAFRNDALFWAVGKDGLRAIKEAITAQPASASPMLFYEIDVPRLTFLAPPPIADKANKDFPGGQRGMVRFTVTGGTALTFRLETNAAVLQFLGQIHEMKASR